jgi:hypothetical protein
MIFCDNLLEIGRTLKTLFTIPGLDLVDDRDPDARRRIPPG